MRCVTTYLYISACSYGVDQALDFFDSDENLEEVTQMMEESRINGVTGVPFTVIDGKWAVSGGQSADVYVQVR
jgi:predicted DsbA family dithiol-disulfide isomerase